MFFLQEERKKKCGPSKHNQFNSVSVDKFESIIGNDTIHLNEVKFNCVHFSFINGKTLFDEFGKWSKEIYQEGKFLPMLIWENINLLQNDSITFNVVAYGGHYGQGEIDPYSSVLVFDKDNKDMLTNTSKYKTVIIKKIGNLIRANNPEEKDFYEAYWTTVNPTHWEQIKAYNKKN